MSYKWNGMEQIDRKKAEELSRSNGLCGYYLLYPDNTESEIDTISPSELKKHFENGGKVGREYASLNSVKGKISVFKSLAKKSVLGKGTYCIGFNDGDETEFDALNWQDLLLLWLDFCKEEGCSVDSVDYIEYVS